MGGSKSESSPVLGAAVASVGKVRTMNFGCVEAYTIVPHEEGSVIRIMGINETSQEQ